MPVEERRGAYGEFTVLVDDQAVLSGGPRVWLGILPTAAQALAAVRARLSA